MRISGVYIILVGNVTDVLFTFPEQVQLMNHQAEDLDHPDQDDDTLMVNGNEGDQSSSPEASLGAPMVPSVEEEERDCDE